MGLTNGQAVVTCLSNASLDRFPNNTLVRFHYHLPEQIEFDPGKRHTVELRAIGFHRRTPLNAYTDGVPSFVKVHLGEISPQIASHASNTQCLAQVPFGEEPQHRRESNWHQVRSALPIALNETSTLRQMSFHLTDEKNVPLQLAHGPPTVVVVVIREMENTDSFSITCSPKYSADLFPDNTPFSFSIQFPSSIDLDNTWEMALHSIAVPRGLECTTTYAMRVTSLDEDLNPAAETVEHEWLRSPEEKFRNPFSKFARVLLKHHLSVAVEANGERLYLYRRGSKRVRARIYFNSAICHMLMLPENEAGGGYTFDFLGYDSFPLGSGYTTGSPMQFTALYCDIVSDSLVGNQLAPLVEIVSASDIGLDQNTEDVVYNVSNHIFRPIGKTSFDRISFHMTSLSGRQLDHLRTKRDDGAMLENDINITLLFRKRDRK